MKRGTPRHPKTYALAQALQVPLPHAVGILEMLWHHAALYTPQGDIGRLPDAAIAEAVSWVGDVAKLIDTLVENTWLDRDSKHRLLIHDWSDHCDQAVRKWLERNGKKVYVVTGRRRDNVQPVTVLHPLSREAGQGRASSSSKKQEKLKVSPGGFEEFWQNFWTLKAKIAAERAYKKLITSHELHVKVLAAVSAQRYEMLQRDPDKRPHAATWLNQRRWEDDPASYAHPPPTAASKRAERAKAEEEVFERQYAEWETTHPGRSRLEFADWCVAQDDAEIRAMRGET